MSPKSSSTRTRKKHRGLLLFFGIMGWFFGGLLLIWLTVPLWLPKAVQLFNREDEYWNQLDFNIQHIDSKTLIIDDIHYQKGNIDIISEGLNFSYTPKKLLKHEVDSILIKPIQVTIDLGALKDKTQTTEESQSAPKPDLDFIFQNKWPKVPYQEILAGEISMKLISPRASPKPLAVQANLHSKRDETALNTDAQFLYFEEAINLQSHLSFEDPKDRQIKVDLHLWDPKAMLETLEPYFPESIGAAIETTDSLKVGPIYGSFDWISRRELISSQLVVANVSMPDTVNLQGIALMAELPQSLADISGSFEIQQVEIPSVGSFSTDAFFVVEDPTLPAPTIQSYWEFHSFELGNIADETKPGITIDPIGAQIALHENQLHLEIPDISTSLFPVIFQNTVGDISFPAESDPLNYAISTEILPIAADWLITQTHPDSKTRLQVEGYTDSEITGPESFHSIAQFLVPETIVEGNLFLSKENPTDAIEPFQVAGVAQGELTAQTEGYQLQMETSLHLPDLSLIYSPQNLHIDASTDMWGSTGVDIEGVKTPSDLLNHLKSPHLNLELDAMGKWSVSTFAIEKLKFKTIKPTHPSITSSNEHPFQLSANLVRWDGLKLLNPMGTGILTDAEIEISLDSHLLSEALELHAEHRYNWSSQQQNGVMTLKNKDLSQTTTLDLHEVFSDMATTLLSAIIDLNLEIIQTGQTIALPIQGSVTKGSLSLPDQNLTVEGIQIPMIHFDDVITGFSTEPIKIAIQEIDLPPVSISNIHCVVSTTEGYTVEIKDLEFQFCEGTFNVHFQHPISAPYDTVSCQLDFQNLNIKKLTNLIPDFKEDLSGSIDGFLPIQIEKGKLAWGEGAIHLKKGTTGRLRYAKDGFLAAYIPEIKLSKKIDTKLNDALKDITLTELSANIQASSRFNEPTVVTLSGHSNNTDIEIPIEKIQLNIRAGDVPELINQSFKGPKWIESLFFGEE